MDYQTPIFDGMKAYYNFTKKHSALKGKTPAEYALITVDGKTDGNPSYRTPAFTSKITNNFFV